MITKKRSLSMKKALKIITPIFLILLVLGSIAWYLLVYDPGFTRDMLLKQARYQEGKGNHAVAAWFYDLAYYQSSQDPAVAIELAEQYKAIGNFTKAEYTLSSAISQGGSAELYVALCKTYVQQDKLLDAVSMLENVSDPQIKTQLEALRPAAPEADYAPGFYTQYISVTVTGDGAAVYANPEGEYPSVAEHRYTDPIPLPAGETAIYAVSVAENGLVSPLTIFGYTVGGVVEPVTFTDAAVEALVRELLNTGDATVLYTNDLWSITQLDIPEDAQSCADLAYMPYLQKLSIHSETMDLAPLGQLPQLISLDLSGCRPDEDTMAAIGAMTALESLNLSDCELSSLTGLEDCTALRVLNLESNTIRNLSVLSDLTNLEELNLAYNAVVSLDALMPLSKLQKLDVSFNSLTSLQTLGSCSSLTALYASDNAITTLAGLERLGNLTELTVSQNQIADVAPLAGLKKLSELIISGNLLTDISALDKLTALTIFHFSDNQVTALPAWSADAALVTVDGANNLVEDLEPLRGMQNLNHVFMDYNKLTDISPLFECPRLVQVNIFGNEVTDVSVLLEMDVVVNYTPNTGTEE